MRRGLWIDFFGALHGRGLTRPILTGLEMNATLCLFMYSFLLRRRTPQHCLHFVALVTAATRKMIREVKESFFR